MSIGFEADRNIQTPDHLQLVLIHGVGRNHVSSTSARSRERPIQFWVRLGQALLDVLGPHHRNREYVLPRIERESPPFQTGCF